jgi:peptidoglycan L-alanyl-D-glutamate endopeptidase CwlK
MPRFGRRSTERLTAVDEELRKVLNEAIKHVDFSVIWGHRGRQDQDNAVRMGTSKVPWPGSKHNHIPARAVDITPYPAGYDASKEEWYELASYVFAAGAKYNVRLRWGGHWKNYTGQGEDDRDWAHFELRD